MVLSWPYWVAEVTREESIEIKAEWVAKHISELPNGKSPAPDGIFKPGTLIDLASIARCLSMLYEAFLDSDRLPQKLKVANVIPVYEGGDAKYINNYRPISLTSIPCKMIEHILLHHLNEILDNVLHHGQVANTFLGKDCLAKPNCVPHIMT